MEKSPEVIAAEREAQAQAEAAQKQAAAQQEAAKKMAEEQQKAMTKNMVKGMAFGFITSLLTRLFFFWRSKK